ncbi:MAG: hypothetical protein EXR53_02560 [Dehalococcoidia bacterium]|nr:hypothetical protein [Dehalococcoidia bacterium]
MLGAAMLRVSTFEKVEADTKATRQAMLVVAIVALATGLGTVVSGGVAGLVSGFVVGLLGWALWAWITFFIGTTIFKTPQTHANWGEMARVLGFAQSPGVLKVLGFIPGVGPAIFVIISVWQLAAMVIAVRQGLDYTSTWRAVGVVLVGFIPYVVLIVVVQSLLSGPMPGATQ